MTLNLRKKLNEIISEHIKKENEALMVNIKNMMDERMEKISLSHRYVSNNYTLLNYDFLIGMMNFIDSYDGNNYSEYFFRKHNLSNDDFWKAINEN